MKKTFSKIAVAALVAGSLLTAGTASANPTKAAGKHAKHRVTRFLGCGSELECDGNGTSAIVTRIFGIRVSDNGGVPNSNLCR